MAKQENFWEADARAAVTASGGKEALERRSKESTLESAEATRKRERAEFILKYGVAPEDVKVNRTALGDTSKTGEEYLATVPKAVADKARMLAAGTIQWPTGRALASPEWSQALNAAQQAYPDLTQDVWTSRHNANMDVRPGGKLGLNAAAINTALGHLQDLWTQYQRLGNTRWKFINGKWQSLRGDIMGDQEFQNARGKMTTAAQGVANELGKIMVGGGAGHVGDIDQWKAKVADTTVPPAEFMGTVNEGLGMIKSRLDTVQGQYNDAMLGHPGQWNALSPQGAKIFQNLSKATEFPEEGKTADVFQGAPEGTRVAGENVKGYRLSGETEAALNSYLRSDKFTPEGYAAMFSAALKAQGGPDVGAAGLQAAAENAKTVNEYYKKNPQAADVPFDYSAVDKAATENAGLGASVAQGFRNLPESAYNLVTGAVAPATDLARSLASGERKGLYAMNLDDVGRALKERYGSAAGVKSTAITDPLGFAADVSIPLTLGGSAMERLPGTLGDVGRGVATAGRAIDPLSGMISLGTEGLPALYRKYVPDSVRRGAGDVLSEAAGFPSGVGGTTVREAYAAGKSKGLAGAETPQSAAFTGQMRGNADVGAVVDIARDAVAKLREQASQRYQRAMAQFGKQPEILPPDNLRQTLADLKPKNYDAMLDAPHRPADHIAWQQMNDTVEHYLSKAQADPTLLEPLAVDQFKQDLYTIGSKIGGATDRDAARIAGSTYRAVRKMLTDHDPVYAETMKDYGDAAQEAAALESGFSLSSPRGKPVNVDQASRKLQSIMRNNANTNYGQRAAQGERLAELDPTGTLMPTLAGQSASSWAPRGLRGNVEAAGLLGEAITKGGPMALVSPKILGGVAAMAPRVAGELAYGAGRGVGAAARVLGPKTEALADLYNRYQMVPLGVSRADEYANQGEDDRLRQLRLKYGSEIALPGALTE